MTAWAPIERMSGEAGPVPAEHGTADGGGVRWRDLVFRRPFRGVTALVGVPGAGKTYALASWAMAQVAAGRDVYCSAGFSVPGSRVFRSVDDFVSIPDGAAVCVDEAPLWFDARAWQNLPPAVTYRLTQVRHYGVELRYTAVDASMVEKRLRGITFDWVEWRSASGPFNKRRFIKSPEGSPQLRSENGPWKWSLMRPEVCDAYDTHANARNDLWGVG